MKKQSAKLPRGRPPKTDDERADDRLEIRLTAAEKSFWQEAADRDEKKLSAWIKDRLNKAASSKSKLR